MFYEVIIAGQTCHRLITAKLQNTILCIYEFTCYIAYKLRHILHFFYKGLLLCLCIFYLPFFLFTEFPLFHNSFSTSDAILWVTVSSNCLSFLLTEFPLPHIFYLFR